LEWQHPRSSFRIHNDSEEHKAWVADLAHFLVSNGIDLVIDAPRSDDRPFAEWMVTYRTVAPRTSHCVEEEALRSRKTAPQRNLLS
jgi:hypothetical protein